MEGWLNVRLILSAEARFNVVCQRLSNTTLSVGHTRPSDLIFNELSGHMMDTLRPSPTSSVHESVMAKAVDQSDTMSTDTVLPQSCLRISLAYSISSERLPIVWSSRLPVAPSM